MSWTTKSSGFPQYIYIHIGKRTKQNNTKKWLFILFKNMINFIQLDVFNFACLTLFIVLSLHLPSNTAYVAYSN